jgi:hypothetical protein
MDDAPKKLTMLQKLTIGLCVFGFMTLVFGAIIGSAWFVPSPWYLCGAIPATATYWILQRDSVVETVVIFLILLLCCWIVRSPVQRLRDYIESPRTEDSATSEQQSFDVSRAIVG